MKINNFWCQSISDDGEVEDGGALNDLTPSKKPLGIGKGLR